MKRRLLIAAIVGSAVLLVLAALARPAAAHKTDRGTTASWYHAAGLLGACGKTMNHHSAASKWFACGAHVMVVRPSGRHVEVVIRDRCQCGIDLDHSAAQALNISGVAKVAMARIHHGWKSEHSKAARWMRR